VGSNPILSAENALLEEAHFFIYGAWKAAGFLSAVNKKCMPRQRCIFRTTPFRGSMQLILSAKAVID
jgi:hypothetical protein